MLGDIPQHSRCSQRSFAIPCVEALRLEKPVSQSAPYRGICFSSQPEIARNCRINGIEMGWRRSYPTHPVRIIVGFAAGSGSRHHGPSDGPMAVSQSSSENRPGAGCNVGRVICVVVGERGASVHLRCAPKPDANCSVPRCANRDRSHRSTMTASAGILAQQTILGCCAEGGSVEGRDRLPVQEGLPCLMHKIISASGKLVISTSKSRSIRTCSRCTDVLCNERRLATQTHSQFPVRIPVTVRKIPCSFCTGNLLARH